MTAERAWLTSPLRRAPRSAPRCCIVVGQHKYPLRHIMAADTENAFSVLKRTALDFGACCFGVASVEKMKSSLPPAEEMADFPYAVSIGWRLSDYIIDSLVDGPTRLYAYHYRVVNNALDAVALRVANQVQRMGYEACPIPSSQIIDWKQNLGHASHRWAAYHAGLGWYGRSNLIISPLHGARVRYVTVFTDMPLPEGGPVAMDCGDCRACIDVCPVGAISEKREDFNLAKCQEQLRFYRNTWNIGHYICGLCIKACPARKKPMPPTQAD